MYDHRHPGSQTTTPASKKTVVVLGSGWGSTSFLKTIDTDKYNVVVVSPRNYFLFTPLLPSCTVGTVDIRSIIEPIRFITRHKNNAIKVYEAECTDIDPEKKVITIAGKSLGYTTEIKGEISENTIPYDYLVVGVGATNQTFGIEGVEKYGCFLKEVWDAQKIRRKLMDCIETAAFPGQTEKEIERLLHMVVVGGGATGIEYAAELHDFLVEDLKAWYPELVGKVKITLVEALPNVLPAFSKELIKYTESTFKEQNISIHTKTMVKDVKEKELVVQGPDGTTSTMPFGLLVWATGNTARPLVRKLIAKMPDTQKERKGLAVDDWLRLKGSDSIYAIGDAAVTKYAPTAQVASQEGKYLATVFDKLAKAEQLEAEIVSIPEDQKMKLMRKLQKLREIKPFHYSHQGSLCYVGSDKAIADLPLGLGNFTSGGVATYAFWRSAYISNLFSHRNRWLVISDWTRKTLLGRDISRE
ncbi:pyridine nucleotide-disulfide oxidoreductase-domain-containing protein [Radiomyces spectabilis]|uniref:pyridine nucleotide-disulfide oxidoreductase-domain-containing protein n=1 Tax=Radiomyces spectabilis TaxID=64574 RepID=UPI00221E3D1F|nr:pyridine nucleotide-disulfide oxidoreductase-domain-containing protein [Radiomyces spectabilis]KAI8379747.1 pyridine nucleotide-disulfide oxidoreductase-domain-containing protein [Radiomyces spectabilis]